MNQPGRHWGLVTELAETMGTSRETLYTIAQRVQEGVLVRPTKRLVSGYLLKIMTPAHMG